MSNTTQQMLDILGTYGIVSMRVDKRKNHFDRFVYVLRYRDGRWSAIGFTKTLAIEMLYKNTQDRMLNNIGIDQIDL